jgi:mono/diheme cytochrome c family protein
VNVRKQTLRLSCRWAASVQGTSTRARAALPWLAALAALTLAMPANAQGNIDAGKSAGQIFADTCAGCHKSARELKRANAGFLRAHYTTGPVEAAAMASYLAGVGNGSAPEPRAPKPAPDKPAAAPDSPPPNNQANRQPQPKAAQAPAGKKGRPVPEPKSAATMILDSKLPDIPDPPPPAPLVLPPATATAAATATAKPTLEPFEE